MHAAYEGSDVPGSIPRTDFHLSLFIEPVKSIVKKFIEKMQSI